MLKFSVCQIVRVFTSKIIEDKEGVTDTTCKANKAITVGFR